MWLISDSDMDRLLDGNFTTVINLKQLDNEISMLQLFKYQTSYKTYEGFRKFFKKHLLPIIQTIRFIDDSSLLGKILRKIVR